MQWMVLLCRSVLLCLLIAMPMPVLAQETQNGSAESGMVESGAAESGAAGTEVAQSVDDRRIEEFIRERLSRIEALRSVRVDSSGGIVQLSGEVVKNSQREIAEKLAQEASGVVTVENGIQVTQDVRERTLPALAQAAEKFKRMLGALPLLLIGLLVFLVFALAARWLSNLKALDRLVPRHRFMNSLLRQGIYYAGLLAGSIIVLDLLDATAWVGALLGTAGIVGLAVGFGVKDLVENQFASILLSLRQPFVTNDHVVIDGKYEGKVVSLNSRATVLMTLDGNHLRLPNALVFKSVILNYTHNPQRRFDFTMEVGVDEDLVRAQKLGVAVLLNMNGILKDPEPLALITTVGDSKAVIQYLAWINQQESNLSKVRSEAIRLVRAALASADKRLPGGIGQASAADQIPLPAESQAAGPLGTLPPGTKPQADVSADHYVDEMIFKERTATGQGNLLDRNMPRE